jgi:Winged helix DNA-binding domain
LKGKPPGEIELSWPQVHAFRLSRHHLVHRAPKEQLAAAIGDIGGAQAQLMSAAELQIGVRVLCTVDDVKTALWKDRSLVKTWLMRGTLHLVPAEDLQLYAAAMSARRIRNINAWLRFVQMSEPEFANLINSLGDALSGEPLTRAELIATVGRGRSAHVQDVLKSGLGGLLKPVARSGRLCFGPSRGQSVTFVRPSEWLGGWREFDPDEALAEVARRYLRAYGPATKNDFARWWGSWAGVGPAAWSRLADELVPVSIEGRRAEVLAGDLQQLSEATIGSAIQLLPSFDPYLLGHASRDHLFDVIHRAKVSRTAGWISAVVLIEGRVAATWTHTVAKQSLRITVKPLERLPSRARPAIRGRAEELAATLGLAKVELKVV